MCSERGLTAVANILCFSFSVLQKYTQKCHCHAHEHNEFQFYGKQATLLKAKYCPRAMPVQHSVNPGRLVQAVSSTQKHKNRCDLDL